MDATIRDLKARIDLPRFLHDRYGIVFNSKGWAPCLFADQHSHGDASPSMQLSKDRRAVKCWAGDHLAGWADCFRAVMKKDGLSFPEAKKICAEYVGLSGTDPVGQPRRILRRYEWTDPDGREAWHLRWEPGKPKFTWSEDREGRQPGRGACEPTLYQLREVQEADDVLLCEGERDADTLNELLGEQGLYHVLATCTPNGATDVKPEFLTALHGKARIYLSGDNDVAGQGYLNKCGAILQGKVKELLILPVPCNAKDWTDWVEQESRREEPCEAEPDWLPARGEPGWTPEMEADNPFADPATRFRAMLELAKPWAGPIEAPTKLDAGKGAITKTLANGPVDASQGTNLDWQRDTARETGPFLVEGGRIVRVKQTREGPVSEPLCNFTAEVTEEIALDDGAETTRAFMIEGKLDTGAPLPSVRVPVSKFSSMNWVAESWGLRAIVFAGPARKDYLREAIQRLSPHATQRHVLMHTGWREIRGRYVYLTAGGAIGAKDPAGYEVDLGTDLARYSIPGEAENPKAAMQASLQLLKLAPLSVTAPLWAGIFRAPLAAAYPLDLSLWIEGQTGSLKSTLCALFLSHFGDFDRTNLAQWSSTANQLERRAFLLKDAVFIIDDYAPNHLDQRELETKASRLLRAQGNLSGRGRLRADLSERPAYHPRGLIVATGEQHPSGQSILARTILTELNRETVNLAALTQAQRNNALLKHAMSGYLNWLAPQMPDLPAQLKATFEGTRERASANGEHLRVPEALAHLWLGLSTGLVYAEKIRAVSRQEAQELEDNCWAALCELGKLQGTLVEEHRPTRRFLTVVATLLTQGKARMSHKQGGGDEGDKPDLIGWADKDFLYLLPEASYRAVATFCRESGAPFATSEERLRRDLEKEEISECEEGRHTVKVRIGHQTPRVLKLRRGRVEQLIDQGFPAPGVPDVPTVPAYGE